MTLPQDPGPNRDLTPEEYAEQQSFQFKLVKPGIKVRD